MINFSSFAEMINFSSFRKRIQQFYVTSYLKLVCFSRSVYYLISRSFWFVLRTANPFCIELCYFFLVSSLGYWFLKVLKPRTDSSKPRNLDLFFTSVSATTVSSMSAVEMEVFSDSQLVTIIILMFTGGEVFTSMAGLFLRLSKLKALRADGEKMVSVSSSLFPENAIDRVELGNVDHINHDGFDSKDLMYDSIRFLGFVVFGYLLVLKGLGIALVSIYLSLVSSARQVLNRKGLNLLTFSVFTTVSTIARCGFVPTNENMMAFRKNSGLLLILIPQILLGNTLFPAGLRFVIWVVGEIFRREESKYLLENTEEIGYHHLLPRRYSLSLVVTVFGFIALQLLMLCSMEWSSESLTGLNPWKKTIALFFQSLNTRHTGESIMDLSLLSPAILVLLVVMMYLPPYTSFLPITSDEQESKRKRKGKIAENLIMSQLSYVAIFVILICITERQKMKDDPLNFNLLNILVEVISAYANVGYTTGYSCKRQIKADRNCEDRWYGFAGRWSDEGKMILIAVMVFGRLKKFNFQVGKAWKLL